jgi:predicted ester cyclase
MSTITGTHKGEFMGMPPTNKSFEITAFDRVKFKDDKAIEHWGAEDDLGMMTQLGLVPDMG